MLSTDGGEGDGDSAAGGEGDDDGESNGAHGMASMGMIEAMTELAIMGAAAVMEVKVYV